ncbi:MBL fold metallo-hydrolase [Desulfobotulus sp. H1]|uniref:MBL fold metallo-hydrolase n=1 Tax=Desulfobotulus pelophilus TaxID=2823377 RepID=A0ABT3NAU4_9BACT|nr:MBL fold metallo-hydrolase [Desulfobotulus pelophilus]MCW7754580.1 MBL fold metallo-hydrolase [Desulfobotulus pelophilus]
MDIRLFTLGPFQTNGYLLSEGAKAVFVDPGDICHALQGLIHREGFRLTHVLITHMHIDHFYGAAALSAVTGAEIMAGSGDAFMVNDEMAEGPRWGYPLLGEDLDFTVIETNDLEILGRKCCVLSTPGHTPGSLTYYFPEEKVAFTGDLIFKESVGRTDFRGGDSSVLAHSIRRSILTLPGDTVLYPGHGPSTTVAHEKKYNPWC